MKVSVATSSVKHSRISACFAVGLLVLESESFATLVQDVSLAEWENVNRSSVLFCCFFVLRRSSYVLEIPFNCPWAATPFVQESTLLSKEGHRTGEGTGDIYNLVRFTKPQDVEWSWGFCSFR